MLHGLALSTRHPGLIWATHEMGNKLLLVDPGAARLDAPPKIMREIDVPGGGRGPHYVGEYEDLLLVSLKGSNQVLVINHTDPQQHWLYDTKEQPIFVARHPQSGEFYASQDQANMILRIDHRTRTTTQLQVPAEHGTTPVRPGRRADRGMGHAAGHLGAGHRHLRTHRRPRCTHVVPPDLLRGQPSWAAAHCIRPAYCEPAAERVAAGLVDHFIECPGRDHPRHLRRRVHADSGRGSRGIAHPALQSPPRITSQRQRAGHRADQRNCRSTRHRTALTLGSAHHSHTG